MSRALAWMVRNPVAANLLMMVLLVGGLMTLPTIRQEEFPSIDIDIINVTVEYQGAAPSETEEGVCIRIEEELEGQQGMDRMTSVAVEGACIVNVEVAAGYDVDTVLDEVDAKVNAITTLPEETEKPLVSKVVITAQVVSLAITGELEELELTRLGQEVRDEIAALPGISQVDLEYARPYEISLEVSEQNLRRYGLTFDEVASAVRRGSLDLPGGSVRSRGGEILLRTKGQRYTGEEFGEIVVRTRTDGTRVTLGEIAEIRDGFQEGDLSARLDGQPAVIVSTKRVGEEDILDIAGKVYGYLEEKQAELPPGVQIVPYNDESEGLRLRLDALTSNARSGLVLVLVTLGLFLRFRLAMWVAAGVPIAFLGAFLFFPALSLTVSTLTVMAFILVLGIVVDDAIVIGEAAYGHEQRGLDQVEAAIQGTKDVYVPVLFGVMTTVAAFLPLILVPGQMGQFFGYIGYTAILCLIFSLVESQWILPSHLAHRRTSSKRGTPNPVVARWQAFQGSLSSGLERFAREVYGGFLKRCLEFRYVTVAAAIGVLVVALALLASGRLRYQFFPAIEGDIVYATLTMPNGIPVDVTEAGVDQMEAAAERVRARIDEGREGPSVIRKVLSTIGKQQARDGPPDPRITVGGSHLAEVSLELIPDSERDVGAFAIRDMWRAEIGSIPDAVELALSANQFSAGEAVNLELRGGTVAQLTGAANALKEELANYNGVYDIADSYRAGKQEVQLEVRPGAKLLGLRLDDLGRQVRQAFYGEEVQRVQRGRDDVRVMLRYPEDERRSARQRWRRCGSARGDGIEVPFSNVADRRPRARLLHDPSHRPRSGSVNVTAEVDRTVTTTPRCRARGPVLAEACPRSSRTFPGVTYSAGGRAGRARRGRRRPGTRQRSSLR